MSCDVCLTGPDDFSNEFHSISTPRARKPHRCAECRATIPAGTRYERASGMAEGDFFTVATCLMCAEIRQVFTCGNSYEYGRLWESMAEEAFERLTTASACFTELSPAAKAFVLDKWRAWKFPEKRPA